MNRTFALVTALAAGMTSAAGVAQTAAPQAPAKAATPPAPVPVQVVQAKIALIEYDQVTAATNEGQRALLALQKKYEPQRTQLQSL
jgi:outer membrane protein